MLFEYSDIGDTVYVVDTSALIKLDLVFKHDNPTFSAIWEEIEDLVQQGQFRIIDFVEEEINSYEGKEDFLKKWVKKWKKKIVYKTTEECINAASPIINEEYETGFFTIQKQAMGKEEADPYLIAYCSINNFTLITDENKNKPNKIPKVAERYRVSCIDIYDFLQERGLKMERKSKNN